MPNGGDRTTLKLHTMWGTQHYEDAFSGMPGEVHQAGCKKTIALVSSPGAFSGSLVKGAGGMGDFDAVLAGVFPGEQ